MTATSVNSCFPTRMGATRLLDATRGVNDSSTLSFAEILSRCSFAENAVCMSSALTPASAQRLVELDDAQQFVKTNLRQTELCLEQVPIRVQCVELSIDAATIAYVSQPRPILQR